MAHRNLDNSSASKQCSDDGVKDLGLEEVLKGRWNKVALQFKGNTNRKHTLFAVVTLTLSQ